MYSQKLPITTPVVNNIYNNDNNINSGFLNSQVSAGLVQMVSLSGWIGFMMVIR